MSELVADCPRCGSKRITFDLLKAHEIALEYQWQHWYEAFCICRRCSRATIFQLCDDENWRRDEFEGIDLTELVRAANQYVRVEGYVSQKDAAPVAAPEHLPTAIRDVFNEGARCIAVECFNAAGTMFRLCVDLATRDLLPPTDESGLTQKTRWSLGLRIVWLFDRGLLPEPLRELSACIKEDGNDGAHAGSLTKDEAEDLRDFTTALLERMYTEPARLRIAKERRDSRRAAKS